MKWIVIVATFWHWAKTVAAFLETWGVSGSEFKNQLDMIRRELKYKRKQKEKRRAVRAKNKKTSWWKHDSGQW